MNKDNDFEVEETFKPIKKGISPIITIIIIMLLLAGGIAYYYFVIESPQNIFKNFIKDSLTKTTNKNINEASAYAKGNGVEIIGAIPYDEKIANGSEDRESDLVKEAVSNLYCRLNLPQENVK